mmetsp:Transcript_122238/g.331924  ORF Transcript_122238/g.331924 Transcript_122238/m.331924 type:complete len:212 (+) Transcript_122238:413-1048(+)
MRPTFSCSGPGSSICLSSSWAVARGRSGACCAAGASAVAGASGAAAPALASGSRWKISCTSGSHFSLACRSLSRRPQSDSTPSTESQDFAHLPRRSLAVDWYSLELQTPSTPRPCWATASRALVRAILSHSPPNSSSRASRFGSEIPSRACICPFATSKGSSSAMETFRKRTVPSAGSSGSRRSRPSLLFCSCRTSEKAMTRRSRTPSSCA